MDLLTKTSSGQQRIILLSIKMCILKIVEKINKDKPILILDDVFSELDENKQKKILESINEINQIFITTTSINEIEKICRNVKYFEIENGKKKQERVY